LDKILRLAVETDALHEVSAITFVETDDAGNVTESYIIPFDVRQERITSLQAKPIDLPPPILEPASNEEEERQKLGQGKKGSGRKVGS